MVAHEDGCIFLNQFTLESIDVLAELEITEEDWDKLGLPKSRAEPHSTLETLKNCVAGIKPILRSPLTDKDYERVAWLFDRIAKQLGVPLSASYPRVKA